MNVAFMASFFEDSSKTTTVQSSTITSSSFSSDGDFYAMGTEIGRIHVMPVQIDKQILPPGRMKVALSFFNNTQKFDPGRGQIMDPSIKSVEYSPEVSFNPSILSCNGNSAFIHQILCEDSCSFSQARPAASLDQFVLPSFQSKTRSMSVEPISCYTDPTLNALIATTYRDETSFLMAGHNGVTFFDASRPTQGRPIFSLHDTEAELSCMSINSRWPDLSTIGTDDSHLFVIDLRQQPENLTPSVDITVSDSGIVSGCKFADNGVNIVVRNFSHILIYDMRKPDAALARFLVQSFPNSEMFLNESGMVNDDFGLAWVDDGRLVTGMYHSEFLVVDVVRGLHSRHKLKVKRESSKELDNRCQSIEVHPTQDLLAITARERLYFYQICEGDEDN
jgi:WD40 repeat protein